MFVPVLAALLHRRPDPVAAFYSMITGGAVSLTLILSGANLPLGLDPIVFGIAAGALAYVLVAMARGKQMAKAHT
jgi:SSS family solute:Na+ symporter